MTASHDSTDLRGLDLVHLLLRRIVRGFYSTKHSIVLDIILKHSAIRDDYLSQMMGLQNQEVRKLCGRLREDRILTIHTRQEPKPGQTRMISRTYYFVENRDAVDAIKYRIHRLVRVIEEKSKNDFESKGYVCPYCSRHYSALDVLPLVSFDGQNFECADCRSVLADDEESMESKVSQERLARLQKQTQQLVSTLKQIDSSFVPDNDFTSALSSAIPPNLEHLNVKPHLTSIPGMYDNSNTARTTTAALGVQIDYNVDQEDSVEEKARKSIQAQMNALPEWHLQSTVSGEVIAGRTNDTSSMPEDSSKDVQLDSAASDQVAEYYKALRAQQLAGDSASEMEEDEEDDPDEEEQEFEDVPDPAIPFTASSAGSRDNIESEDEFEDIG